MVVSPALATGRRERSDRRPAANARRTGTGHVARPRPASWWEAQKDRHTLRIAPSIWVALIFAIAIATSAYLIMHFSPYQTCVRNMMA